MDILEKMTESQKNIYNKYKDNFPFPIVEFINELKINIFTSDMSDNISGSICKEDKEYVIYINPSHPSTRLKFTLAHELGHFFYDKEYLDNNKQIIDYFKQSSNSHIDIEMRLKDIKANQFAAELLMPENIFIKKWIEKATPEKVAKFFGVSLEATKIRASSVLGEIF